MRPLGVGVLFVLASARASATMQCTLLATPAAVRIEGLAERLGDIVLRCSGGGPGAALNGSFGVWLSERVANSVKDGYADVSLAVSNGSDWVPVASQARVVNASAVSFDNVALTLKASGELEVRVAGLRATGARAVQAVMNFDGTPRLGFSLPYVTASVPQRGLLAGDTGLAECPVGTMPGDATVDRLIAAGFPFATTRVTEGYAAAFEKGMRILVQWTAVPAGARVVVPDFVAGSSALTPTAGGDFGVAASAGRWVSTSAGSLLLGRVTSTDAQGAGGRVAAFEGVLGSVSDADRAGDTVFAVYEVLDASLVVPESAQFPAFLALAPGSRTNGVVHSTASFAPVPSFTGEKAPLDCLFVGDCAAPWFPRMSVRADTGLTFRSPQKSGPQTGFLLVHNVGGGILEWGVSVRYLDGSGWITPQPARGLNQATVAVNVTPGGMPLGTYRAEVSVQAPPPAVGISFPVEMTVVTPLPPAVPLPKISAVANAASRAGGPVAPASVVVVTGEDFAADAGVTMGGELANVLSRGTKEMLVISPAALQPGTVEVVVRNGDQASAPYRVEIAAVAPAIFGVLNQDGSRNSDTAPAQAGDVLQVFATGVRVVDEPLEVRVQGQVVERLAFAGPAPGLMGILQINVAVPGGLSSAADLAVCGNGVCSRAVPVSLR